MNDTNDTVLHHHLPPALLRERVLACASELAKRGGGMPPLGRDFTYGNVLVKLFGLDEGGPGEKSDAATCHRRLSETVAKVGMADAAELVGQMRYRGYPGVPRDLEGAFCMAACAHDRLVHGAGILLDKTLGRPMIYNGAPVPDEAACEAAYEREGDAAAFALGVARMHSVYDRDWTVGPGEYWIEIAELFRQAQARDNGDAAFELARLFWNGYGVEPDAMSAFAMATKAADLGCARGHYFLFEVLRGQDDERSLGALRCAVRLGLPDGIYQMGLNHYHGDFGCKRDAVEAAKWIGRAAEMGVVRACYSFAVMLQNGDGVARDLRRAHALMKRAADLGHVNATYDLAGMMQDAECEFCFDKAGSDALIEKAAAMGQRAALFWLGSTKYTKGEAGGFEMLSRAANLGHADAMYNLAVVFYEEAKKGAGDVAYDAARHWFELAAAHGNEQARELVARVRAAGGGAGRSGTPRKKRGGKKRKK